MLRVGLGSGLYQHGDQHYHSAVQIRFYLTPGIISVFSPEQFFIYIRLQFALQFGLFSISIGFISLRVAVAGYFSISLPVKLTSSKTKAKQSHILRLTIFSMYRRPIIDFKHGLSACSIRVHCIVL